MKRRLLLRAGILAATAAAAATLVVSPAEAAAGWQVSLLPLPAGHEGDVGHLGGTGGRGDYAGVLYHQGTSDLVMWKHGTPALQPLPDGYRSGSVVDENPSGVVVGDIVRESTGTFAPFVMDGKGIRILPAPGDSAAYHVVAVNKRGDILGYSGYSPSTRTVLWPAHDYDHPVVLAISGSFQPRGLDDDGTVLLNAYPRPALWRDGQLTLLTLPSGTSFGYANAIRDGVAVGNGIAGDYTATAVLWRTPDKPEILPGGHTALGINRFGLIAGLAKGDSPTTAGPLTVWLGTRRLGALPQPDGFPYFKVEAVGDDGTIAGVVNTVDPDYLGGHPAVWRWSSH